MKTIIIGPAASGKSRLAEMMKRTTRPDAVVCEDVPTSSDDFIMTATSVEKIQSNDFDEIVLAAGLSEDTLVDIYNATLGDETEAISQNQFVARYQLYTGIQDGLVFFIYKKNAEGHRIFSPILM